MGYCWRDYTNRISHDGRSYWVQGQRPNRYTTAPNPIVYGRARCLTFVTATSPSLRRGRVSGLMCYEVRTIEWGLQQDTISVAAIPTTRTTSTDCRIFPRAPVFRVFGSYAVSKDFPLAVRSDVRQSVGRGPDGMIGDVGAYMPMPGSSEHFVLFAGPSVTIASRQYLDKRFGVTASRSPTSGFASYRPRAGATAAGLGVSSTTFITDRLMINVDGAMDWLRTSAPKSSR